MITISFFKFAILRKLVGIRNLPCLSISHSLAPDKKNLVNSLEFLFERGKLLSFSSKFVHSESENAN